MYFLSSTIATDAPFLNASSTKSFPLKLSPLIAINKDPFFMDLVSIEISFINILATTFFSK